jgi:hypothetical protein
VAAVRSAAMEGKGKKSEPWVEVVGVHSLPLAPGTLSGYVGVRLNNSKKRPWQAWVHIKGEKRRCIGSFEDETEAAVARAAAIACGVESLPSPRKQAPRKSGTTDCHFSITQPLCLFPSHILTAVLVSHDHGQ